MAVMSRVLHPTLYIGATIKMLLHDENRVTLRQIGVIVSAIQSPTCT